MEKETKLLKRIGELMHKVALETAAFEHVNHYTLVSNPKIKGKKVTITLTCPFKPDWCIEFFLLRCRERQTDQEREKDPRGDHQKTDAAPRWLIDCLHEQGD